MTGLMCNNKPKTSTNVCQACRIAAYVHRDRQLPQKGYKSAQSYKYDVQVGVISFNKIVITHLVAA